MLVHLSNVGPYVCDLNRGPIERADRMASTPAKKVAALLEQKESFPKHTRTPLKLLAPDEVPMDSTVATADVNASLQPIWYSEQTIVDDHHVEHTLNSSAIPEEDEPQESEPMQIENPSCISEDDELINQPSLMRKSSTFTIEPSIDVELDEKENTKNAIVPPSDDSFRALEHLLGLGSAPTTTIRESPKTNHDTLSLTVVTPTDIIDSTTTSLRMSFAPKALPDSLPSSQEIPKMPTIDSITSTNPPSFLAENTTVDDEQMSTSINQQSSTDMTNKEESKSDDDTNFSFELNDFRENSKNESITNVSVAPDVQPINNIRAPTCADVAYRALTRTRRGGRTSQPVKAESPLARTNKHRSSAPSARTLRSSCRRASTDIASKNSTIQEQSSANLECLFNETKSYSYSQTELIEMVTLPEEDEIEQEKIASVTLNLDSTDKTEPISTPEKSLVPLLSREYTFNTPKRRSSARPRSMLNGTRSTMIVQPQETTIREQDEEEPISSNSMLAILLTKPTENKTNITRNEASILPSPVRCSVRKSERISSNRTPRVSINPLHSSTPSRNKSLQMVSIGNEEQILTTVPQKVNISYQQDIEEEPENNIENQNEIEPESINTDIQDEIKPEESNDNFPNEAETPEINMENTTEIEAETPEINMENTSEIEAETPEINADNATEMKTPETNIENQDEIETPEMDAENQDDIPEQQTDDQDEEIEEEIRIVPLNDTERISEKPKFLRTIEIGVQTTPSLDMSTRRRLNQLEPQATPLTSMNKSTTLIIEETKQITPIQTKIIATIERSVRFQLTPTTDARIAAKEKFDEQFRGLKPDIVIQPTPEIQEVKVEPKAKSKPKKKAKATKKGKTTPIESKPKSPRQQRKATQKKSVVAETTKSPKKSPKTSTKVSKKTPKSTRTTGADEPISKKKTSSRKAAKTAPIPEKITESTPTTKRTTRKRATPETAAEPTTKRMKTSQSVEIKPLPTNETSLPKKTRARSTDKSEHKQKPTVGNEIKTRNRSKDVAAVVPITKKRRLESAEKPEVTQIVPVAQPELSQDERQKIGALTVNELKLRLNKHKETVPKGAKKSELVTLLMKIETNLLKEEKTIDSATTTSTIKRSLRHKK